MRSAAAKKIKRESRDNTDIDKSIMFGSGCYVQFHKHYYPKLIEEAPEVAIQEMSACGTKPTCRCCRRVSAVRG
jgi:hypothetical protein